MFGITMHGGGVDNVYQARMGNKEVAATETSAQKYREDLKLHKRATAPQQEFSSPVTTSHDIGWVPDGAEEVTPAKNFRHRGTEVSHYADCATRHYEGRSVAGEFSDYGQKCLDNHAMPGHTATSGRQHPTYARYGELGVKDTEHSREFLGNCGRGDVMAPTTTRRGGW